MVCFRCKAQFCWSCMLPIELHDKWYYKCPKLQMSICNQILVTMLVILFLPVILLVGPIIQALLIGVKDWTPIVGERL